MGNYKGGYTLVDLKRTDFVDQTDFTIKGTYKKVEQAIKNGKIVRLTNFKIHEDTSSFTGDVDTMFEYSADENGFVWSFEFYNRRCAIIIQTDDTVTFYLGDN